VSNGARKEFAMGRFWYFIESESRGTARMFRAKRGTSALSPYFSHFSKSLATTVARV
jgi:hypothetical protein